MIGPVQQALAEGEMDVMDAYEMEWDLAHQPVLSWEGVGSGNAVDVGPNKKAVIGVKCLGKFGW